MPGMVFRSSCIFVFNHREMVTIRSSGRNHLYNRFIRGRSKWFLELI